MGVGEDKEGKTKYLVSNRGGRRSIMEVSSPIPNHVPKFEVSIVCECIR
jgi:hypothetical protein